MGWIEDQSLPECSLFPVEEVGDSAVVESLVPLILEDPCGTLQRERQAGDC